MCAILYFFLIVCNKPHANPTIIYENIKEIHILAVGGTLEFPILSHKFLRRVYTRPYKAMIINYTQNESRFIIEYKCTVILWGQLFKASLRRQLVKYTDYIIDYIIEYIVIFVAKM